LAISTLPILPECTNSMARRVELRLRAWVPCWTMHLYFRAASTNMRPSRTLCEQGFSTYTSLPAWQARMAAGACQ
jgi:hypothetical protein